MSLRSQFPSEYTSWLKINQRCYNPRNDAYVDYGGRGITVSPEWRNNFASFLADVGPKPSPEYSLDRYPNKDGNYEPGNVRWADFKEQNRNKRDNVWVDYQGRRRLMIDVCAELGLNCSTVYSRRRKGLSGDLLFSPVG